MDNSVDRVFRSFLGSDMLILHDLVGPARLTAQQSADLYELISTATGCPASGKGCLRTGS